MGLNMSPSFWQSYINEILDCLETRKHCKVIMDDLLLFTPTKKAHMAKLEDFIEGFAKEWTQNINKKCQLFKTELQYMGNTVFIKDRKVCVRPLRSWIDAILKLEPPKMPKRKKFCRHGKLLKYVLPRIAKTS